MGCCSNCPAISYISVCGILHLSGAAIMGNDSSAQRVASGDLKINIDVKSKRDRRPRQRIPIK